MNNQATQNDQFGSLGFFFPQPQKFQNPSLQDLKQIKFRGKRTDLQVYHLAYGTKKLRACTYSRMAKRQKRINQKKAKLLIVKSPQQREIKANKQIWLRNVSEMVKNNKLQAVPILIKKPKNTKGARLRKMKKIKKIREKIAAKKSTEMKD